MNYYEILGLTSEADKDQIKKAYHSLAKIYHPDKIDTGDEDKFLQISEAYETLSNEESKKKYDLSLGKEAFDPTRNTDIYSQVFSSDTVRTKQIRGEDVTVSMNISMQEALSGVEKEITLKRKKACKPCNGKGKILVATEGCERCGGAKVIIEKTVNPTGATVESRFTCPDCRNVKDTFEDCEECEGLGVTVTKLNVPIVVPKGVKSGVTLRVKGQGKPGQNGGLNGDLLVKLNIKDDSPFKIDGGRLTMDLPVKFRQLVLGDAVDIDVYGKTVYCLIPKGANPGDKVLVRNTGYVIGNSATDAVLEVTLKLDIPLQLNQEQITLLNKLNL